MSVGFTRPEREKLKLRLELTEPNEDAPGEWSLVATASATLLGEPAPDVEIRFFHNGRSDADSPAVTDSDGRAVKEYSGLRSGTHTFEAQIVGLARMARATKKLREAQPRKPGKILVARMGGNGRYTVTIQVLTEDSLPVPGATVRTMMHGAPHADRVADRNGVVTHNIAFDGKKAVVSFMVLRSDVSTWINLFNKATAR